MTSMRSLRYRPCSIHSSAYGISPPRVDRFASSANAQNPPLRAYAFMTRIVRPYSGFGPIGWQPSGVLAHTSMVATIKSP